MSLAGKLREVREYLRVGMADAGTSSLPWLKMKHALAALPDPEDFEGSKVLAHSQKLAFELAGVKQQRDELAAQVETTTHQYTKCIGERDELAAALRHCECRCNHGHIPSPEHYECIRCAALKPVEEKP